MFGLSWLILQFLNGYISVNVDPINTKLENCAKLGVLFLTLNSVGLVLIVPQYSDSYPIPHAMKSGNVK